MITQLTNSQSCTFFLFSCLLLFFLLALCIIFYLVNKNISGLRKNDENGAPPQGGQSEQLSNNTSASNINYPPYSQGNSSRGEHDGTRAPQYYNQQQHSYR